MPSKIDNIIIQVRSRLQELGIKLWLEPYYYEGVGAIDSELERLATEFSGALGIPNEYCKAALSELQDGAINKLRARQEFAETGIASFNIRAVQKHGNVNILTVKCALTDTGRSLQEKVAKEARVNFSQLKLICAGKVIQSDVSLKEQGLNNNHQLMALISSESNEQNENDGIYNRVRAARRDAEIILESKRHTFFGMEDQDGNAIHLPPKEQKAITLALALYEKGRAALKKENYDEALVMFLEADEQFSFCNSKLLDSVDNYALLNLDIVWCYLCLKSVTHLPDAERRLTLCEQSFRKSYGDNMNRVLALKGSSENEKALLMRLHLLQGVLLFHQNQRDAAHEKLSIAESELQSLKVDENSLLTLIDMGYNIAEARIALRSCAGDIQAAINNITEHRERKKQARKRARQENAISRQLLKNDDHNWVNVRSICTLVNMGFSKELAYAALHKSKNDVALAVDYLQNNQAELVAQMQQRVPANDELVCELVKIGFDPEMAKIALETAFNNSDQAIDLLLNMQKEGNYNSLLQSLNSVSSNTDSRDQPGPSTGARDKVVTEIKNKIKMEMDAHNAYQRFSEDVNTEDDEYLDLPLIQEENILLEYKRLLEQ